MNFLQLKLGDKLGEGIIFSVRVGLMVGRAIDCVFSIVEVTRKDRFGGVFVVGE